MCNSHPAPPPAPTPPPTVIPDVQTNVAPGSAASDNTKRDPMFRRSEKSSKPTTTRRSDTSGSNTRM